MGLRMMVTGASGTMGQELVKLLDKSGADFIAASRSLNRLPVGIRGLQLNYDSVPLLEQAFRDIDVLFFLQPFAENMVPQATNVFRAARSAGVQFVLRVSGFGASASSPYLYQRVQGEVDELLKNSGLKYCLLRPNIFMQSFVTPWGEALRQGILYLPQGEGRTSFLHAKDAAEVAARILLDPLRFHKFSVDLTGERALSNAEVVSLISYEVQRRVCYVPVTEDVAIKSMQKSGIEPWDIDLMMSIHRAVKDGKTDEVSESFRQLMNRDPRRFEDFIKESRDAWIPPTPVLEPPLL